MSKSSMICMSITWLVALRLIPDLCRYINGQKKDTQGIPPLKRRNGNGVAESELEQAEEFNGQFRMCSTKMSTAKSRSQIGRFLS